MPDDDGLWQVVIRDYEGREWTTIGTLLSIGAWFAEIGPRIRLPVGGDAHITCFARWQP